MLVPAQLPEVPPPLVVMLPLLKHQRKKPRRPNPHPKKTTIWVSDFSTKSHASRLSGTSNKTIFQRSNFVFLFLAGVLYDCAYPVGWVELVVVRFECNNL